jgi:hypothetical protein
VPPLAIVENLNVLENVSPGLVAGQVIAMMHQFGFQGMEKALHRRIIPAVSFAAHRTDDAVLGEPLLVGTGGILAAADALLNVKRQCGPG